MRAPVREAVVRHVEVRRLDARQLEALQALQGGTPRPSRAWWRRAWVGWGVAAALLLLLASGWMLRPEGNPLETRIAAEVAANHLKLKPLEVEASDMRPIRDYFRELDFVPVDSALVATSGLMLTGGRYCSIQGAAAAQLRLRRPEDGALSTLYQAPYEAGRHARIPRVERGEPPLTVWAQGMPVRIWAEKGVLFALVGPELDTPAGRGDAADPE